MLVVDAGALYEVVTRTAAARAVEEHLLDDPAHAAPHVVDVEVFGVVRMHLAAGRIDGTTAHQAVRSLAAWGATRYPHRPLLERAWELRSTVRGRDAMYVALAESLDAVLLTTDARLARAPGPTCRFEVVGASAGGGVVDGP